MTRPRNVSNSWELGLANLANPSRYRQRNVEHRSNDGGTDLLRALDDVYKAVGDIAFRRICESVYLAQRSSTSGLVPVGGIKDHEAEVAAKIALEFEELAKTAFLRAFLSKSVRESIVRVAISGVGAHPNLTTRAH